ncbi:MAG: hypothetical protein KatS3mg105_4494 [Gemmatales bacterium]|nr:MAG: hypothetical protein KatS3mg105_4494 [Gemmatales bacterium]
MPRLIVIKGPNEGKQFDLVDQVHTVGRDASNRFRLTDTEVSRRHAEFRRVGNAYRLIDVGSANGTYVNNQPIKDVELRAGDHIRIGQSILVYTASRNESQGVVNLADRIHVLGKNDVEIASAIVKTIGEAEGTRFLSQPEAAAHTPWLKNALANLSVMYEASQAVSHILDLDQLLERIMDLIFRSIDADRGCILLRNPSDGRLEPKAIRWREQVGNEEKIALSRTIVEYVLREKQGVLVSDAAQDERFNTGQSIVRFGIQEAICVPMKGRHETLGVIYLDTRTTARDILARRDAYGKFTEDHLALAIAIGHQAALAVEETRYHQAMVQAERLAAIGQTIAALSHSIKNMLQGLRSGAEIIRMGLNDKDDELLERGWTIFDKSQGKIYNLVMDMLSFSKEREPAIEDTDLNALVSEIVDVVRGRAREMNAALETRLAPDLPLVPLDPEGLHKALLNVVSNALDAVEEQKQPQVRVSTMFDNEPGWVRVEVLDNGTGIPANKIEEIFKPFISTKGSKGTGLGLAVSRKILREHGGDITVESSVGKGSKFIFRLPLKSPLRADAGASQETIQPGALDSPEDLVAS